MQKAVKGNFGGEPKGSTWWVSSDLDPVNVQNELGHDGLTLGLDAPGWWDARAESLVATLQMTTHLGRPPDAGPQWWWATPVSGFGASFGTGLRCGSMSSHSR
jgi:hypothetical protein